MRDLLRLLPPARPARETLARLLEDDIAALREESRLIEAHDWPGLRRFHRRRAAVKAFQRENYHLIDVAEITVEQEHAITIEHYRTRIRPKAAA